MLFRSVVRQTPFVHRHEPRAFSSAPADAFRHRRPDVRIAAPSPEARRVKDTDRRSRPEYRRSPEVREQTIISSHGTVDVAPHRERAEPPVVRRPQQPRSESPTPQHQETAFRREAPSRRMHTDSVREAPPTVRIEPTKPIAQQIAPPSPRERPHMRTPDRPGESARPPEPRREMRAEARQVSFSAGT